MSMSRKFAVVDLFAGPGGLAEGFSSVRSKDGTRTFQIELSVEKEVVAFQTLRLRSFLPFRRSHALPGDRTSMRGPWRCLVALGLMALVSPPTQHPLLQVLIGLLVAHVVAPSVRADPSPVPASSQWPVAALVWAAALACAVGLGIEGWTAFRPPDRASRFLFPYNYGLSAPVRTALGDGRWAARRAVAVVAPEGAVLVARVVLPHDDLSHAPVAVTISEGHRVLCERVAHDQAPIECRVPVPAGRWPFVQVEVSRGWRTENGMEQAALVSGRFEP